MPEGGVQIIANPVSGWGKGKIGADSLINALEKRGVAFTVNWTEKRRHALELTRQVLERQPETVVACGGDGTIHEVVQVMAGKEVPLAVFPAGRCNDFARFFGPLPQADDLVGSIIRGETTRLDLGRAPGKAYFCTVGAVGYDAEVSRYVDEMRMPLKGAPAYIYAGIQTLCRFRPAQAKVEWDGGSYDGPLFLAAAANTPTYGNQIRVAPGARPDDGMLNLCIIKPGKAWKRVYNMLRMLADGRHEGAAEVMMIKTTRVRITADRPIAMWADGEPVTQSPLEMQVRPGCLKVIKP